MLLEKLLKNKHRYIIVGGKGGVGKTSISASIAVSFANLSQKTLIISTDPAHSLSDSLDQDISGGQIHQVDGIDNLYAMEINPEEGQGDLRAMAGVEPGEKVVDDLASSLGAMGLGMEDFSGLMETLPPGVDEAMALAKVVQIIDQPEYADFERVVFDTAPTGHTLRLLSLPVFLDSFMGKLIKMRVKLSNIGAMFKSMMGRETEKDNSIEIMEKLKENIIKVKDLFRNQETTEFIIVTIPTIMAANESVRLSEALELEDIPVKELVINQIMPNNVDCPFCSVRSKGQKENLDYLAQVFHKFSITHVPFFDREIRGIDGLKFMSSNL